MYAVIKTGGKQYRVSPGYVLVVGCYLVYNRDTAAAMRR